MAFSEFEDAYGSIEAVFFPNVYEKNSSLITSEKVVELKGKISFKENEKPKILVDNIKELGVYSKLFIKIKCYETEEQAKTKELFELLKGNEGEIPVYVPIIGHPSTHVIGIRHTVRPMLWKSIIISAHHEPSLNCTMPP